MNFQDILEISDFIHLSEVDLISKHLKDPKSWDFDEIKGDPGLIIDNWNLRNPIPPLVSYPDVFTKYSRYFDGPINQCLRNITSNLSDLLGYDIENLPETSSITLYRAITQKLLLSPGDKIVDKRFMSKSLTLSSIFSFVGELSKDTLMILHYPNPNHQIYMPNYSYFPKEQEMLSLPGEEFQVKARFTSGNYNILYAQLIPFQIKLDSGLDELYLGIEQVVISLIPYLDSDIIVLYLEGQDEYPTVCGANNPIYLEREAQGEFLYGLEIVDPESFLNQVEGLFYNQKITAIYRARVDNYRIFKVRSRNQELEIEEEIDTIGLIDRIIQNRLEGIEPGIPLPEIQLIWTI